MSFCVHVLTSVNGDPMRRGTACGRPAKHVNEAGEPVCGYHEPGYLARLRARNPFVGEAARRGGYASARTRWGFEGGGAS